MTRPRRVFGRRRFTDRDGVAMTIEMREDGVYVKRLHSRRPWRSVSFDHIATLTAEQLDFLHPLPKVTPQGPPAPPRSGSDGPGTSESTVHEPRASKNAGRRVPRTPCPAPGSPSDESA